MDHGVTRRAAGATGMLTGISLPATLQMLSAERRDCVVEVDSFEDHGELTLEDGQIIAAQTGPAAGTAAAFEILQWPDVTVRIQSGRSDSQRDIFVPLQQLLIDSYRLDDEHRTEPDAPADPRAWGHEATAAIDSAFDALIEPAAPEYDYASLLRPLAPVPGILTAKVFDLDAGVVVQRQGPATEYVTLPFWEADELTRQQLSLLMSVTTQPGVKDGVIMYAACVHLFRPVTADGLVVVYLTLETTAGNLMAARHVLQSLRLEPQSTSS